MKKSYGNSGTRKLSKPPSGGPPMRGIDVPRKGNVKQGARMTTRGAMASAGEKGRAYDVNCDKVRSNPANP